MLNPPTLWAAPIPNPEGVVLIFCNPLTPRPGNPQSEGSPQGDSGDMFFLWFSSRSMCGATPAEAEAERAELLAENARLVTADRAARRRT